MDEKIRLTLQVNGVADVKALEQEMRDLAEAFGAADVKIEKAGDTAKRAKKPLEELGESAKGGGRGLSNFAYAVQDLSQGGLGAVLNNVQQLAMGMGLGAGVAGGAQLALTGVLAFRGQLEKLLEITKPTVKNLEEFASANGALTKRVTELKKEIDELAKSETDRAENLVKLRSRTSDLANEQERLNKANAAAAEAEKLRNNPGTAETTEAQSRAQSFKESVTDTGKGADFTKRLVEAEQEKARAGITPERAFERLMDNPERRAEYNELRRDRTDENGAVISKGLSEDAAKNEMMKNFGNGLMLEMQDKANESGRMIAEGIIKGLANPKDTAENDKAFAGLRQTLPGDAAALRGYHQERLQSEALDAEVDASSATMRDQRLTREAKEAREQKAAQAARAAEMDARQKAAAAARVEKQAQEAEEQRVKLRDRVMSQNGLTPEGMAAQRQNAGVGATAAANRNRSAMANDQQRQLQAEFRRQGMAEKDAAKTTQEVMTAGDKIVRAMIQNGQATLNRFKQIELTQAELARMMAQQAAQQAAGQVGMPGRQFNAGRR